jgi:hypothetical protein
MIALAPTDAHKKISIEFDVVFFEPTLAPAADRSQRRSDHCHPGPGMLLTLKLMLLGAVWREMIFPLAATTCGCVVLKRFTLRSSRRDPGRISARSRASGWIKKVEKVSLEGHGLCMLDVDA